jgi:hypothetical protein
VVFPPRRFSFAQNAMSAHHAPISAGLNRRRLS